MSSLRLAFVIPGSNVLIKSTWADSASGPITMSSRNLGLNIFAEFALRVII